LSEIKFSRRYLDSNSESLNRFINAQLSGVQKDYIIRYYCQGKTMREIAEDCGVNVSTVSRTIRRGQLKIDKAVNSARLLCG
jgi:RNA polymerase sigma factor (sigma-70 family)